MEKLLSSYYFAARAAFDWANSGETASVRLWDLGRTGGYRPRTRGSEMIVAVLTAILIFSLIVFCAWRLVKEKSAEAKAGAAEEMRKSTPDSNELL
jgi:hypothetical protein